MSKKNRLTPVFEMDEEMEFGPENPFADPVPTTAAQTAATRPRIRRTGRSGILRPTGSDQHERNLIRAESEREADKNVRFDEETWSWVPIEPGPAINDDDAKSKKTKQMRTSSSSENQHKKKDDEEDKGAGGTFWKRLMAGTLGSIENYLRQ